MAAPLRTSLARSSGSPLSLRRLTSFSPAKAQVQVQPAARPITHRPVADSIHVPEQLLQRPDSRLGDLSKTYYDESGLLWAGFPGDKPPDPNKAKLGKTLRILQERLPTLLQSPLPQTILAPGISLQLFPSTHPHLPTVSGRVAYNAALWTSPIAWNRVPIIGNVKLDILAERMTSEPLTFLPRHPAAMAEQLVVRWCEKRKSPDDTVQSGRVARSLWLNRRGVDPNKAFTGLFIFDFDSEGRILTHTIEQAQEGGNWEKGMGAKFVGLTDWLLGGMKNPGDAPLPMFERVRK